MSLDFTILHIKNNRSTFHIPHSLELLQTKPKNTCFCDQTEGKHPASDEKRAALDAFATDIHAMKKLSTILKGDKEVVMTAVSKSGYALEWGSEELKNDREVVLTAVRENGPIFSMHLRIEK